MTKALGVVAHSASSIHKVCPHASLFPNMKGNPVVVLGVEQFFLALKKEKAEGMTKRFLVLDLPGPLLGIGLELTGITEVGSGRYTRIDFSLPEKFPTFVLDRKRLATKLTLLGAKTLLSKEKT